jgi:hypothetical protein
VLIEEDPFAELEIPPSKEFKVDQIFTPIVEPSQVKADNFGDFEEEAA